MAKLEVGDRAPEFELPDASGRPVRLSQTLERGPVLLVFYPGDFSPVCTRQLCSYRDSYERFVSLGVQMLGISDDTIDKHRRFTEEHHFPFSLLADPQREVIDAYAGTGMMSGGRAHRAYFLVGQDGRLAYIFVEKVSVFYRGADELFDALRAALQVRAQAPK
ncbi:peroxiredoxin [Lujinxingia sediminis]|uniref:thioredoxin-dependent peroxiredoxin n=1 Tax=Lujinxingia sediminis TaxID=2480984 RepID=A0ABY0CQ49_9DELT|nr:peroxiredoxin [Lujinxingia sediminis]RVU42453.1 peroxiredoxin [Lujinxingia sediminis]